MAETLTTNGTTPTRRPRPPVILGTTGLRQWSGYISEEWYQPLAGTRYLTVFKEMSENDAIIGASLLAIGLLVRQVTWTVMPSADTPDAQQAAEWVKDALFTDMIGGFDALLQEILSMNWAGWAYHEVVYKRRQGWTNDPWTRSRFNDGQWGWHSLPIRAQETLDHWEIDDATNQIRGMVQRDPVSGGLYTIPMAKAALFRPQAHKGNPQGRALTLETPVPTPDGWTTMGALEVGDKVYDEQGRIRYVTAKSPIWQSRPVYEIEFAGGHTIIADANHEWVGTTFNDRNCGRPARLRTTQELYDRMQAPTKSESFCLGTAPVLDAPKLPLPFDPYLLGYWLGDGSTGNGAIAVQKDDLPSLTEQAEAAGFDVSFDGERSAYISGIKILLRSLGVLQSKHIPPAYLRAHWTQRLALLQGLMDADGSASLARDRASKFYNSNPLLVQQICELVRSLGGRPHTRVHTRPGKVCGTINGKTIIQRKVLYEVAFFLHLPVHRLPRKLARQDLKDSPRVRGHFIRAIRPVGLADTVCIEVDSPSHLFLAGEGMVPTHNSLLRNVYRPWYFSRRIEELQGIGIERDLAGLPVIYVPPELLDGQASAADKQIAETYKKIVTNIRRGEQEGVVLPMQFDPTTQKELYRLELLSTGGQRQFDTTKILEFYNKEKAIALLTDVLLLGHERVGSFALASSKTNLLALGVGAICWSIAEVFNEQVFPPLWALNGWPYELMPTLQPGDVETVDLDELGNFIVRYSQAGLDLSDLENEVRRRAGLPLKEETTL